MIVNKVKVDEIWKRQPAPEDELVHIICHCIFDKRKVSQKYINRIQFLLTVIEAFAKSSSLITIALVTVEDAVTGFIRNE